MREFFRGWRRKAGCAALLVAFLLTCLWLRARVQADAVYFNEGRSNVISQRWWMMFVWFPAGNGSGKMIEWRSWNLQESDPFYGRDPIWMEETIWQTDTAGIQAGTYLSGGDPVTLVAIPFLWLIAPLTVFSAYLILWKPRTKPPAARLE